MINGCVAIKFRNNSGNNAKPWLESLDNHADYRLRNNEPNLPIRYKDGMLYLGAPANAINNAARQKGAGLSTASNFLEEAKDLKPYIEKAAHIEVKSFKDLLFKLPALDTMFAENVHFYKKMPTVKKIVAIIFSKFRRI